MGAGLQRWWLKGLYESACAEYDRCMRLKAPVDPDERTWFGPPQFTWSGHRWIDDNFPHPRKAEGFTLICVQHGIYGRLDRGDTCGPCSRKIAEQFAPGEWVVEKWMETNALPNLDVWQREQLDGWEKRITTHPLVPEGTAYALSPPFKKQWEKIAVNPNKESNVAATSRVCPECGVPGDKHHQCAGLMAERNEWKSRAEKAEERVVSLEARIKDGYLPTIAKYQRADALRVAAELPKGLLQICEKLMPGRGAFAWDEMEARVDALLVAEKGLVGSVSRLVDRYQGLDREERAEFRSEAGLCLPGHANDEAPAGRVSMKLVDAVGEIEIFPMALALEGDSTKVSIMAGARRYDFRVAAFDKAAILERAHKVAGLSGADSMKFFVSPEFYAALEREMVADHIGEHKALVASLGTDDHAKHLAAHVKATQALELRKGISQILDGPPGQLFQFRDEPRGRDLGDGMGGISAGLSIIDDKPSDRIGDQLRKCHCCDKQQTVDHFNLSVEPHKYVGDYGDAENMYICDACAPDVLKAVGRVREGKAPSRGEPHDIDLIAGDE